jgi:Uncharacterized protein related to methyl coenzyme M reductase subunit C
MRRKGEIAKLEEMAAEFEVVLDEKRKEIEEDPLAASPLFIKELIEMVIPPKAGEEFSIVIHLDGLRVKIEEEDEDKIREIQIGNRKLSEICDIKKSRYEGHLLKIRTEAETGRVF